jgi:prolyl-tRNA synthetase
MRGGEKNWYHVKRGVPIRVEVGPRDLASNSVFVARRDLGQKAGRPRDEFIATIGQELDGMQATLFQRALELRRENTREIDSLADFRDYFTANDADKPEIHGGFAWCHFHESPEVDEILKEQKVTIRCIPVDAESSSGTCIFTRKPSPRRALFAKAY